ncbi:dephospho-CoA kinase, partial [Candidatus Bathyarchaeota archaeon]|nr:dephospho-CoA kinase [Candidatus Bathyarchaeota archaeon]
KIIQKEQYLKVVVDGIRSLDEVEVFRRVHSVKLISIHASPGTRFKRLSARGRSDDANQEKIMIERDLRELRFGIGSAIAMADYMVVNEGSIQDLRKKFEELMECLLLG